MMTQSTRRVAIVDDDHDMLDALASLLRSAGLEVLLFSSGTAFLDSGERVDCLLSDLHMPGCDGISLIRKANQQRPTPALILTAFPDVGREQALAAGAMAFLPKPVNAGELLDWVTACLDIRARRCQS